MSFERRINYYETDAMGVVHHSNYIRFLEEARLVYLDNIDLPYKYMEDNGVMIPVLGVKCEYKFPARFNDIILVDVNISEFNGVKMKVFYTITNKENGNLVATAETVHCFTDSNLRPLSLKKHKPDMFEKLNKNYTAE